MFEVTEASFDDEVLGADRPVLVDFWAPWCGPCKALAPFLEQIERDRPDVKVVKVNIEDERALVERLGVASVPTVMRFDNGTPTQTVVGLKPKIMLMRGLEL
jgi:thioredoxin 1